MTSLESIQMQAAQQMCIHMDMSTCNAITDQGGADKYLNILKPIYTYDYLSVNQTSMNWSPVLMALSYMVV